MNALCVVTWCNNLYKIAFDWERRAILTMKLGECVKLREKRNRGILSIETVSAYRIIDRLLLLIVVLTLRFFQ